MKLTYLLVITLLYTAVFANPRIHSDLQNKLNSASPNEKIPIMIIFDKHLSLNDFNDISYDTPKKERRAIVVDRLMRFSKQSHLKLTPVLSTTLRVVLLKS